MKFFTTLATVLLWSTVAQSGQEVGNGGDVVVCRDSQGGIKSIELLDFYEAREYLSPHIMPSLGEEYTRVWEEKVQIALLRLKRVSPLRYEKYRAEAETFRERALFKSNIKLVDVTDSKHLGFPTNCHVEQVAVWTNPSDLVPGQREILINDDLWIHMAPVDKAGLVLHEIIYKDSKLNHGHTHSRYVRHLTARITSREFEDLTQGAFVQLMKNLKYKFTDHLFANFWIIPPKDLRSEKIEFHKNGLFKKSMIVEPKSRIKFAKHDILFRIRNDEDRYVHFYKNGNPRRLLLSENQSLSVGTQKIDIQNAPTHFYPNGALYKAHLAQNQTFDVQEKRVPISGTTYFYRSGKLWKSKITDEVALETKWGMKKFSDSLITFDRRDRVSYWASDLNPNHPVLPPFDDGSSRSERNYNQFHTVKTLEGHSDWVSSVALNPKDKNSMISGSGDRSAIIWDIQNNKIRHRLRKHISLITAVAISPDGKVAASAGLSGNVNLWNMETGKRLNHFNLEHQEILSLAFSPNKKFLLAGSKSGWVFEWSLEDNKIQDRHQIGKNNGWVNAVTYCQGTEEDFLAVTDKMLGYFLQKNNHDTAIAPMYANHKLYPKNPDASTSIRNISCPKIWEYYSTNSRPYHAQGVENVGWKVWNPAYSLDSDQTAVRGNSNTIYSIGMNGEVTVWYNTNGNPNTEKRFDKSFTVKHGKHPLWTLDVLFDREMVATGSEDGRVVVSWPHKPIFK